MLASRVVGFDKPRFVSTLSLATVETEDVDGDRRTIFLVRSNGETDFAVTNCGSHAAVAVQTHMCVFEAHGSGDPTVMQGC